MTAFMNVLTLVIAAAILCAASLAGIGRDDFLAFSLLASSVAGSAALYLVEWLAVMRDRRSMARGILSAINGSGDFVRGGLFRAIAWLIVIVGFLLMAASLVLASNRAGDGGNLMVYVGLGFGGWAIAGHGLEYLSRVSIVSSLGAMVKAMRDHT